MSWEQLLDIAREAEAERRAAESAVPTACPDDGIPLESNKDGDLHCSFCGWRNNQ